MRWGLYRGKGKPPNPYVNCSQNNAKVNLQLNWSLRWSSPTRWASVRWRNRFIRLNIVHALQGIFRGQLYVRKIVQISSTCVRVTKALGMTHVSTLASKFGLMSLRSTASLVVEGCCLSSKPSRVKLDVRLSVSGAPINCWLDLSMCWRAQLKTHWRLAQRYISPEAKKKT